MTFLQMREIILSVFPNYTDTLVKIDLNAGYRDFCSQTRLPRKSYNIALTTATNYTLGSDVDRVYSVEVLDSSSQLIDDITYEIDNKVIYFYGEYGEQLASLPDTVYSVTVYYYAIPTALSGDADVVQLPAQFEYAPIEYVFAKYYRRQPTMGKISLATTQMAQQAYMDMVNEAKRLSNQNSLVLHTVNQDEILNSGWLTSITNASDSVVVARTNTRIPSGTTASRPVLTIADIGYVYFDTDMSSPIWWNGTAWV